MLKYSPSPPCETSSSSGGLTPVSSPSDVELRPVAQGEFTRYGTLLDLENVTVDLRALWLNDSRTRENERQNGGSRTYWASVSSTPRKEPRTTFRTAWG